MQQHKTPPKHLSPSVLQQKIMTSLNKIIADCSPPRVDKCLKKSQNPENHEQKYFKSLPFELRSLQYTKIPIKKKCNVVQHLLNPKAKLKQIIKRYDYFHIPSNASKVSLDINSSIIVSSRPQNRNKSSLSTYDHHPSYQEILLERQKEDDYKKIMILKQVIKENVKKKSQQLRIYLKKK